MNYKIVDVEGIGAVYAEKLIAAGVCGYRRYLLLTLGYRFNL